VILESIQFKWKIKAHGERNLHRAYNAKYMQTAQPVRRDRGQT